MLHRFFPTARREFKSLSEQEILALAISSEEDDARIYLAYADGLRDDYPNSAKIFEEMADEENTHRARLIELHKKRFGDRIPLIRREHVRGYYERKPDWLVRPLGLEKVRAQAAEMEAQAHRFYLRAAQQSEDADTRKLLGELALAEAGHQAKAEELETKHLPEEVREAEEQVERRQFILTYVQPGLAGLMDGSVSTLAPIFATAFATQDPLDDLPRRPGRLGRRRHLDGLHRSRVRRRRDLGRGSPMKRGLATGIMTTVGGLGHALPYLIPHFWTATIIAMIIVVIELWAIAWIQKRWMETPWSRAIFQVVLGGALVFAAGMLIGNA
jgi:rubrerythrin